MYKLFLFVITTMILIIVYLVHLIKTRQIKTEYSIIWIVSLLILLLISSSVKLLNSIAYFLGISYPPSLIIVIVFFLGIFILLSLTKTITKLSDRNKINMQNIAISDLENFKKNSDILIIIPAYNEENNIGELIKSLQNYYDYDIIVINDGSTDKTPIILDELDCPHIDLPYTSGYGVALETGYIFSSKYSYKYTIQIDADGQHEHEDITTLVNEIEKDGFDAIIGSRFLSPESAYKASLGRNFGIIIMKIILNTISNKKITDPTSGYQILNSKVINFFSEETRFPAEYPDADMLLLLYKNQFQFKEVPVRMYVNDEDKSMHDGFFSGLKYSIQMLLSLFVISISNKK